MKKTAMLVAVLAATIVGAPATPAGAKPRRVPVVNLTISNFRFCKAASCAPLDAGYVRTSTGPVSGSDNSMAVVGVKRGSIVRWTYRDGTCDAISGCTGHNIYFENGKTGKKIGAVPARRGAKAINYLLKQRKGTTIRYFCTVNGHYMFGMTGILHVT